MLKTHLTGHKGLVGSAIKEQINTIDYHNRISEFESYDTFIKENSINTIIHTAARVGGVLENLNNKIEFYLENSKISNIVFEAAMKNKVKNFVNFSSTCVFPDKCSYPLKEEDIFNGPPHYTNDGYAYAKRMMQYMCQEARAKEFNYFTIIPTNIFGPRDNYHLEKAHVLPALIHKFYLAKLNGTDITVWGTGSPLREFVFSKDLGRITKLLIETKFDYDSVIVSTSEEISIKDCVGEIARIMKFNGKVNFDTSKPDGQFRKPTDTTRLRSILPDFKFTPFSEALEESVEWFMSNYDEVRK